MKLLKNNFRLFLFLILLMLSACTKQEDRLVITYETEYDFHKSKNQNGIDTNYLEIVGNLSKYSTKYSQNFRIYNYEESRMDAFMIDYNDHEKYTYEFNDTTEYRITHLPEEKNILGFTCKKAIIETKGDTVIIFYTNEIKSQYSPLGKVDGCVLEFTYHSDYFKKHSIAVAKSESTSEEIKIPDDYKKTTVSEYSELFYQQLNNREKFVEEGQQAPEFSILDMNGRNFNLLSKRGKVLVFNFWNISCSPCIREMPELNEMVDHFKENDQVEFHAFTRDSKEKVIRFQRRKQFDFNIIPLASNIEILYGVNAFPTTLIIDQNGKIASTYKFTTIDSTMLGEVIQEIEDIAAGPEI